VEDENLRYQVRVVFPKSHLCLMPLFECTTSNITGNCSTVYITNRLFAHCINRPIQYTHTRRRKTDTFLFYNQIRL
jgi:hypothetical protein